MGAIFGLIILVGVIYLISNFARNTTFKRDEEKRHEEKHNYYAERSKRKDEEREREAQATIEKYKHLKEEEVLIGNGLRRSEQITLLRRLYNRSPMEAMELVDASIKAKEKMRKKALNRKVNALAQKLYGDTPSDDKRLPIPDDVKDAVWRRDLGKCVKCGSQERLEFDHMIPVAKGGSNTARNIQILCEKCNREKRDNIG